MPKPQLHKRNQMVSPRRVLALSAALVVAFLLATSVIGLARKYVGIRRTVGDLKEQQQALIAKKQTLEETNDYIATAEGQERELRGKYNIVRPGEGVILVSPPELPARHVPTTRVGRWWDSVLRGLGIRK